MSTPANGTARARILARVRRALADVPPHERPQDVPVPRDYLPVHGTRTPDETVDLLAENLRDYRALVHRVREPELPGLLAELLDRRSSRRVVVPAGLPDAWLATAPVELLPDRP
ncbi:lactate utilization protein C, partial [Streptomyces sp. NPDC049577]